MLSSLFGAAVVALGIAQTPDTIIAVRQGNRLEVENIRGDIVVQAWNRDAVRINTRRDERSAIEVRASGNVLQVRSEHRRGIHSVDLRIDVPTWMPVRITGPFADATVQGT